MSRNNPIPVRLRVEFFAHMGAHNFDDLSDGAWFATLENAASEFARKHNLRFADSNTATHQYLRQLQSKQKDESGNKKIETSS